MSTITIALLQMTACGDDQDANLAKGETFCRQAREMGADIALFPEMWNVGYTFYDPRYGLLTSPAVEEPFVRPSARR